jgi:polyisoprenoid-binding protein YceI
MNILTKTLTSLVALTAVASSQAALINFKIGSGSQAQQIAQVESATDFETFTGRTDKVTGNLNFDLAKKTGAGKIIIDAASINTGIDLRDEHMRSPNWLDTAKYKTITFETTSVKFVKGNTYKVTGKFTMHGVTKTLTTNVDVKYLKESKSTKNSGFKGDVLQVKTNFNIKLSDFKVMVPDMAKSKVSNNVKISVTVYGQSGA